MTNNTRSISTYQEAVDFLYRNLPIFQRVGAAAYKADLDNTIALCKAFSNPHKKFKSVHIAGTNGKGSSSHMIASILQSAGYKTGLYTSPHLKSFTERIRINGEEVSEQFVLDFVNRVQPELDRIKPSFFEITVVMAFEYFVQQNVDIAVIEVGLGGRLDSTNVIAPDLSLITNIGWDHKDILGDTLEKIAFEKAGIIKKRIPVVISERQSSNISGVFIDKADHEDATITFASDVVNVTTHMDQGKRIYNIHGEKVRLQDVMMPLQGKYQEKNVKGAIKSVEILQGLGYNITESHIREGIEKVVIQTSLKGRWQKLQDKPMIICDTGHNEDGVKEVLAQLVEQDFRKLHMVWGMVKDKDISNILALLPKDATYYFCEAKIPRAMSAAQLSDTAARFNLEGQVIPDVNAAIDEAKRNATHDDLIFVGGSTFVVAEINGL
jgi:dihydrofolate synthase / folylpolyglutamate synthase